MKKKLIIILTIVAVGFTSLSKISAEESRYNDFSVTPIYSENQLNNNVGYYDLRLNENQVETVVLRISNEGQETMNAELQITNAVTDDNAAANYHTQEKPSESAVNVMTDIASLETSTFTVEPGESIDVPIVINAPEKAFDGVVLGGVAVIANGKSDNKVQGTGVVSAIKYLVAIQLSMTDNVPEKELVNTAQGVKIKHDLPAYYARISNPQSVNMKPILIQGKLYDTDGKTVIGTVNNRAGNILPNSQFDVVFDMINPNKKLKNGDYKYEVEITDGDDSWSFEDQIHVIEELSTEINNNARFENEKEDYFVWVLSMVVGALLVVIVILYHKLNTRKSKV